MYSIAYFSFTDEDMVKFRNAVHDIVDSSPQRLYAMTGCSYSCVFTSYTLTTTMTNTLEGELVKDYNYSYVGVIHLGPKVSVRL